MKIRQWIFPVLLALLFAAVLLAGLVPWDRILPEKEEEKPAPVTTDFLGTTVSVHFHKEHGNYTVQQDYTDGVPDGVLVTFHLPNGDFSVHYPSEDDIPENMTITYQNTDGDVIIHYGDDDRTLSGITSVNNSPYSSAGWAISRHEAVTVEGSPSYCRTRNGSENNWVIYLAGGGMSVDARTADQPRTFYTTGTAWNGIWDSAFFSADPMTNPFYDWSYLLIPCDTADCYIGAGEFTSVRGAVLHHNGYTNFTDYLDTFALSRSTPDKILLAGSSAGGFGAAMLAAEVCERFPEAEITVLVDCACLSADWRSIAEDVWHAPEGIVARMETDDCVTDALVSLKETYGGRVKILYLAVESDTMLIQYQEYLDTGDFAYSPVARDHYNETLRAAVKRLREEVPGAGIWIWRQTPIASLSGGGVHMLVPRLESTAMNGLTALEWVKTAVLYSAPPLSLDLEDFLGE